MVIDLDFTLWRRPRFRNGPPFTPIDGGLGGVCGASGERLTLYEGARDALRRIVDTHRIPIAFVSRTHRPAWAREWLAVLKVDEERTVLDLLLVHQPTGRTGGGERAAAAADDDDDGAASAATRLFASADAAILIRDGRKDGHVRELASRAGVPVEEILFFDDAPHDCAAVERLGARAVHCPRRAGLTAALLEEGLARFACNE